MEVNKAILEGMTLKGVFSKMIDKANAYEEWKRGKPINPPQKTKPIIPKVNEKVNKFKEIYKKILSETVPIINRELSKVKYINDRLDSADTITNRHCSSQYSDIYHISESLDLPWETGEEFDDWYTKDKWEELQKSLDDFQVRLNKNSTIKKYGSIDVEICNGYWILHYDLKKEYFKDIEE